mgnify:CR=1 FL=1
MLKVNAIGDNCPIPVIKTKKAMQEVNGKETIEVLECDKDGIECGS